jgi:hypothetical protein
VTVEEIAIKRERLRDASTMADFEALVRDYGLTLKEVMEEHRRLFDAHWRLRTSAHG